MLPQKSTYFEGTFLLLYFHSMNVIKKFSQQNVALESVTVLKYFLLSFPDLGH